MPEENFVDLEIRIFPAQEAGYPVEITLGRNQVFPRGYAPPALADWTPDADTAGRQLWELLVADPAVRDAWVTARGQAPARRIRLWLDQSAPELHPLRWEYLQDADVPLAANAATPFSRYLPVHLPWRGAVEGDTLRVLVAIANPNDLQTKYNLAALDVAQEQSALAEVAGRSQNAGESKYRLEMTFLPPPITLPRLEEALRAGHHIFHYIGHGAFNARRQQAVLFMEDAAGATQPVRDDELAQMFARQDVRPHLIFLTACQGAVRATGDAFMGLAPKLIQVGVPAVVAMQDFISIETARLFNTQFYQLVTTEPVDKALNQARSILAAARRSDMAVPVLLTRLEANYLWNDAADTRGKTDGEPRVFWKGLMNYLQRGKCTPIIGPRARDRWTPPPTQLAQNWAKEHDYPFTDTSNPADIAQYMATSGGIDFARSALLNDLYAALKARVPEELRPRVMPKTLSALVDAIGWQNLAAGDPNDPHTVLANLNLPLYLTTNFDNFLTAALTAQGKKPVREVCRWNDMLDGLLPPSVFDERPDFEPTPEEPLVYHLLGYDIEPDSLVLTEDDHLDYLAQISAAPERIHPCIRAALANTSLMFLGYDRSDWAFRVIMRGLLAPMQQRRKFKHVGVQVQPGDVATEDMPDVCQFFKSYFQQADTNVFLGTALQFVAELREWWEAAQV